VALIRQFVAIAFLLGPCLAGAQPLSGADAVSTQNDFEVWIGYSPKSTDFGIIGRHPDLSLFITGLRYNRRIRASSGGSVEYTFDAIPFARVGHLIRYGWGDSSTVDTSRCRFRAWTGDCIRSTIPAYGIGFNPIGFSLVQSADRRLVLRVGANGGVLWFDRPAPSDIATRFNYTASAEAGLQLNRGTAAKPEFTYRMHHLSNAGRGSDNLAMLSHIFSLGFRWR
jgi:hypothetical protein